MCLVYDPEKELIPPLEETRQARMGMSMNIPQPEFLLRISNDTGPIVDIRYDGTVVVYQEGAEPEAARRFYDALQIEGQSVAELRQQAARLKEASGMDVAAVV